MTLKQCIKCHKVLPADAEHFHRCAAKKDGLTTACKACRVAAVRAIRAANKRPRKERDRSTYVRGEAHYRTKLAESDARLVLSLLDGGLSERVISNRFGVSRSCVAAIRQCRSWTHL